MPIFWIVVFILLSLISRDSGRKRRFFIIASFMVLFTTNAFIVDEFMRKWEYPAIEYEKLDGPYDYGILLSGMMMYDYQMERINFYRSADRLLQTMDLYHRGYIKKIVISGGSGFVSMPQMKESVFLRDYLVRNGIPERDILIEKKSKNTYENAKYTTEMLTDHKSKSCLLITSAFHMKRAIECFEKQGLVATPFVADRYSGPRRFDPEHLLLPNEKAMHEWTVLIHDVVGYIVYSISGYL